MTIEGLRAQAHEIVTNHRGLRIMPVTHFIETSWKDGDETRYMWRLGTYGKPTKANLERLTNHMRDQFITCRLVHADTTVIATIAGK